MFAYSLGNNQTICWESESCKQGTLGDYAGAFGGQPWLDLSYLALLAIPVLSPLLKMRKLRLTELH